MKTNVNGATVYLPESELEDGCREQIAEVAEHEAFSAEDIRVMPDTHWGSGAPIGFTMPIQDSVVPNIVGVDIGCFAPETPIETLEGEISIKELAERDSSFGVYSCTEDGSVKISEATATKTRANANLIEVEIDTGEVIACTPDHEFMLRNGSYREAQNLSVDDSLMPLYKSSDSDGYTLVHDNKQWENPYPKTKREHWMVARSSLMDIPKIENPVIHHKNFKKDDNRVENLEIMSASEHTSLHIELSDNDWWQSEEFEKRRIQAIRNRETTQAERDAARENITTWMEENPEKFEEVVQENGERGKKYLKKFNTSSRECSICGNDFENPASEYWHQIRQHPDKTDYAIRNNHKVTDVREIDRTSDVYCLTVPEYGNFALSAGVFVHNCGMAWARLDGVTAEAWENESWADDVDEAVRDAVPMGFNVRSEPAMHIVDEFPWDVCDEKLDKLLDHLDYDMDDTPDWFEGYGGEYFKTLCKRVGYDINRAIMSLGSLGGGNHFIEFARSVETDSVYVTLHSGSRGIGAEIAQHWQEKAHTATFKRNADVEIPKSEWKYIDAPGHGIKLRDGSVLVKAGDIEINREAILEDYDGEAIEGKFGQLKQYMNAGKDDKDDLDWLEGTEAIGYYIDMIFAQTYAAESRRIMREEAAKAVGAELDYNSSGQAVHNYIDFDTGIIRKGATSAKRGEIAFIPYNMKDGSLLVRGKGNEEWNYSAPHGAGRVMSRTEAKNVLSADDVENEMDGIHTTNIPLDEAPDSYKDMELIETALQPTADIIDRLKPLHNLKA